MEIEIMKMLDHPGRTRLMLLLGVVGVGLWCRCL